MGVGFLNCMLWGGSEPALACRMRLCLLLCCCCPVAPLDWQRPLARHGVVARLPGIDVGGADAWFVEVGCGRRRAVTPWL